jgi:hypothetical protein
LAFLPRLGHARLKSGRRRLVPASRFRTNVQK